MELIIAHSKYQRRRFQECIQLCDKLLGKNPRDSVPFDIDARTPGS
jgi:hypothetical protein